MSAKDTFCFVENDGSAALPMNATLVAVSGFVGMGINHGRGIGAMNYSLDFAGGSSTTVTFNEAYTLDEIDN